jgi:C1A family cysteine protease
MSNQNKMLFFMQFTFILFFFLINNVKTDLPVHCLLKDVQGKWDFIISDKTFDPNLDNEEETSCGHGLPNKVVSAFQAKQEISFPNFSKLSLELMPDFKVFKGGVQVGSWTLVYDQSLLIQVGSKILTAPFKYYKHLGNSEADSDCYKTFLGWHIPDSENNKKNWSCFYGEKRTQTQSPKANSHSANNKHFTGFLEIEGNSALERYENKGTYSVNNISTELIRSESEIYKSNAEYGYSFIQTKVTNRALIENNMKYEQMGKVVQKLNKLNLGWEADINPKYIGMSFMQVKHQLGLNKGKYNNYQKNKSDKFSLFQIFAETESSDEMTEQTVEEYLKSLDKELSEVNTSDSDELNVEDKNEKKDISASASASTSTSNSKSKSSSKLKGNNKGKSININEGKVKDTACANCVPKIPIDPHNPNKMKSTKPDNEREADSSNVKSYDEVIKYLNTNIEDIDETKLPKNWDWRNVGGKNYVPPVRNQGKCGSCYTFSTLTSLESRLRVQTNLEDQTIFSKQFPLSCNFYSEGCDGGYPVLVAKFSKEFELVPEDCFEYTQKTVSCKNVCNYSLYPKKYTVKEYGYLGGAYGKTTEAQMIKEIRARGPIPGNMLVHWSFQYYKGGVYSQQGLRKKNSKYINLKDLFDYGMSWAKVEHSITLVGYGEENGVKYWIGMNTWGADWGEKGFFRIVRGENEAMIESMGDFMNIQVEKR